jgi:hypothetical protein
VSPDAAPPRPVIFTTASGATESSGSRPHITVPLFLYFLHQPDIRRRRALSPVSPLPCITLAAGEPPSTAPLPSGESRRAFSLTRAAQPPAPASVPFARH